MIYILIHGLVDTTYWRNDLAVVFWMIIAANLYSLTVNRHYHRRNPPPPLS